MSTELETGHGLKRSNFPKYRSYPVPSSRKYLVFGKEIKLIDKIIQETSDFPILGNIANVYIRPLHELSVSFIAQDLDSGSYIKMQTTLGSGRFRSESSARLEARQRDELLRRR